MNTFPQLIHFFFRTNKLQDFASGAESQFILERSPQATVQLPMWSLFCRMQMKLFWSASIEHLWTRRTLHLQNYWNITVQTFGTPGEPWKKRLVFIWSAGNEHWQHCGCWVHRFQNIFSRNRMRPMCIEPCSFPIDKLLSSLLECSRQRTQHWNRFQWDFISD